MSLRLFGAAVDGKGMHKKRSTKSILKLSVIVKEAIPCQPVSLKLRVVLYPTTELERRPSWQMGDEGEIAGCMEGMEINIYVAMDISNLNSLSDIEFLN